MAKIVQPSIELLTRLEREEWKLLPPSVNISDTEVLETEIINEKESNTIKENDGENQQLSEEASSRPEGEQSNLRCY